MEMRYAPTLVFYGVMDKIGLEEADHYPDWERSPLTLELRDKKHHRRCFLSSSRAFFEAVWFSSATKEYECARKIFERVHHEVKFTKIHRVGIRQWASVKLEDPFSQLVKLFAKKFHPANKKLDGILRGTIDDLSYVADVTTANGWKYHLRLGPMQQSQWFELIPYEPGLFESAEEFTTFKNSFGERMLFVDLDIYREDITYADLPPFLDAVRTFSGEMVAGFVQYLQE